VALEDAREQQIAGDVERLTARLGPRRARPEAERFASDRVALRRRRRARQEAADVHADREARFFARAQNLVRAFGSSGRSKDEITRLWLLFIAYSSRRSSLEAGGRQDGPPDQAPPTVCREQPVVVGRTQASCSRAPRVDARP
jgi:hypothetical protein